MGIKSHNSNFLCNVWNNFTATHYLYICANGAKRVDVAWELVTTDLHGDIRDLQTVRHKVEITSANIEENGVEGIRYASKHKVHFVEDVTCMEDGS